MERIAIIYKNTFFVARNYLSQILFFCTFLHSNLSIAFNLPQYSLFCACPPSSPPPPPEKIILCTYTTPCLKPHIRGGGGFSSGIEGALAWTLNHDFNWKQLSEMILCIIFLMFSKFIWVTLIQKQQEKKKRDFEYWAWAPHFIMIWNKL